jgi:adenylate kinase family enzyme
MLEALKHRTVIIGNSGSGKSVFAKNLAALTSAPVIDLDRLHWEDAGFRIKREEEAAKRLVRDAASAARWIIEGSTAGSPK